MIFPHTHTVTRAQSGGSQSETTGKYTAAAPLEVLTGAPCRMQDNPRSIERDVQAMPDLNAPGRLSSAAVHTTYAIDDMVSITYEGVTRKGWVKRIRPVSKGPIKTVLIIDLKE